MSVELDTDIQEFRRAVGGFLATTSSEEDVRRLMATDTGYDAAAWERMANELGLQGTAVAEEYGGSGFGYVELGVALEEMGWALYCGPFLATVAYAVPLIEAAGPDVAATLLPGIASGETIAAVAAPSPGAVRNEANEGAGATGAEGGAIGSHRVTAQPTGEDWSVTGVSGMVLDGHVATLVLLLADGPDGPVILALDPRQDGVTVTLRPTLDQTRKHADLMFEGARAELLECPDPLGAVERARNVATIALATELTGGARRTLDLAVQYGKDRVQFGRPIGSFQSLKHMCSDMLIDVESSRAAATTALEAIDAGSDELSVLASLTLVHCAEAYLRCVKRCIQLHGAIGTTWEHPAHLYLKRAVGGARTFGTVAWHRRRLARHLAA